MLGSRPAVPSIAEQTRAVRNSSAPRQGRSRSSCAGSALRSGQHRRERAPAGRHRLRWPGGRGNQGRSVHRHGAGGPGDAQAEARHLGRHRFSPEPHRDGDERLDLAETVARPLYLRPRHAGEGAHRAPLRHAVDTGRPLDPRVCAGCAGGMGQLAERHAARRQGPALQHQSHGAAVQSRPDRASARSRPSIR